MSQIYIFKMNFTYVLLIEFFFTFVQVVDSYNPKNAIPHSQFWQNNFGYKITMKTLKGNKHE